MKKMVPINIGCGPFTLEQLTAIAHENNALHFEVLTDDGYGDGHVFYYYRWENDNEEKERLALEKAHDDWRKHVANERATKEEKEIADLKARLARAEQLLASVDRLSQATLDVIEEKKVSR